MTKFHHYCYSLPLAMLLAVTAQSAHAGPSSWYIRGEGGISFMKPKVDIDSGVGVFALSDVPPDASFTLEEFFGNEPNIVEGGPVEVNKGFSLRGPHFAAGIGRHINKNYRMQLDYVNFHLKSKTDNEEEMGGDNARFNLQGGVLSAYYDIELDPHIAPYLMAGVGYGRMNAKYNFPFFGIHVSEHKNTMIGQVGLGSLIPINDRIALDFGYKCTFTKSKIVKSGALSYSPVEIEFNGDEYDAIVFAAESDMMYKVRPIHSLFLGLKFNIN